MALDARRENDLTDRILGCAYQVMTELGHGFVEKVYENALAIELTEAGFQVEQQRRFAVRYAGKVVGEFAADLIVEETVVVELKAVSALDRAHQAQCLNYLRASGLKICLLLNFGGPALQIRRIVNGLWPTTP